MHHTTQDRNVNALEEAEKFIDSWARIRPNTPIVIALAEAFEQKNSLINRLQERLKSLGIVREHNDGT